MRFVALALILLSLPLFVAVLKSNPQWRRHAFTAIGALLFFGGSAAIDASIVAWPLWPGPARGLTISPVETLALALILTRPPRRGLLPFWSVIALYALMLVCSLFAASIPVAALFTIWQLGRVVLLFAAIGGECDRAEFRQSLYLGIAFGLMLQAAAVISQKLGGVVQATGTMDHQNVLGMLVELGMLPLLAALLGGERRKLILVGLLAAGIVIAGGGSRGALAIAGVGAVLMVLLSLTRGVTPAKMRVLGFGALAAVVATPVAVLTLRERFGDESVLKQEEQRSAFSRAARAIAVDHPFGVGANQYVTVANTGGYSAREGVAWGGSNRAAPVHNAYLLARAETGWQGEFAFILLLAWPALRGLIFAFGRRRAGSTDVALGSAVSLGVVMAHSNLEYAAHLYNVQALIFVHLGLIAAQIRAAKFTRPAAAPRRRVDPAPADAAPALTA